jgi:hypothetical protein
MVDSLPRNGSSAEDVPTETTTIIAPAGGKYSYTVIFLYGREDFGSDLARNFFDSKASNGRTVVRYSPLFDGSS